MVTQRFLLSNSTLISSGLLNPGTATSSIHPRLDDLILTFGFHTIELVMMVGEEEEEEGQVMMWL